MIVFLRSWCEGIIVATCIETIVELVIPENSNKKYINIILGLYMLFVIINPILDKLNMGIDLSEFGSYFEDVQTSYAENNEEDVKNVYKDGVENFMKNMLIEDGYNIKSIDVEFDKNAENIEKVSIELENKSDEICEKVKNKILEVYEIEEDKILFL